MSTHNQALGSLVTLHMRLLQGVGVGGGMLPPMRSAEALIHLYLKNA